MEKKEILDIVIIGAGPIGLATAARLTHNNLTFIILEKGETVGNNMSKWGHIQLFSNWEESMDTKCIDLLNRFYKKNIKYQGFPTGNEFIKNYLHPLAKIQFY